MEKQPLLPRFLVHLRQRLARKDLTVVIGAGATRAAGAPLWGELLHRIRAKVQGGNGPDLTTYEKMGVHPATIGTILRNRFDAALPDKQITLKVDDDWFRIIQAAIYADVPEEREEWFEKHVYLLELTKLCFDVKLIINFNFDDIISESMRFYAKGAPEQELEAPSLIWKPTLLERRDSAIIYHINGVITKKVGKKRSETLVFTEDSFYDAELRSPRVRIDHVLARFVETTMFIVGHSLSDNSLKGYLRQSKMINPANHHYFVHWTSDDQRLTKDQMSEIFDANLELYNLVTIFLQSTEIHDFLAILNSDDHSFNRWLDTVGALGRNAIYIVGPVAAGKTSVLEYLRCFDTHEEWIGENPKEMYLASDKISDETAEMIDNWVYDQIARKNRKLQGTAVGFVFIDRGPLDLFAFEREYAEWPVKARRVATNLNGEKLVDGQVAFLNASGEILEKRNWKRGRTPEIAGNRDYLSKQADTLRRIYLGSQEFRTDRLGPAEIAAQIARAALFGEHKSINLHGTLSKISCGEIE